MVYDTCIFDLYAGLSTLYIHTDISPKGEKPEADFVLDHMDMKRITEILMS